MFAREREREQEFLREKKQTTNVDAKKCALSSFWRVCSRVRVLIIKVQCVHVIIFYLINRLMRELRPGQGIHVVFEELSTLSMGYPRRLHTHHTNVSQMKLIQLHQQTYWYPIRNYGEGLFF